MSLQTKQTTSSRNTTIGRITLLCTNNSICALKLPGHAAASPPPPPGSLAETAFDQIEEYLAGKRQRFQLPLHLPDSTCFERKILRAIAAIPYGATTTYGSLGPARAVGRVCAGNPLPLLIPCHRVIPVSKPPGQYQGGTALKTQLLAWEQSVSLRSKEQLNSCNGLSVMLGFEHVQNFPFNGIDLRPGRCNRNLRKTAVRSPE